MAYKMKGFPMHEGVSPMKQTNPNIVKVGPYNLDISTEEGVRALEEFNRPSERSTTFDVEELVKKNIEKSKPKKETLLEKLARKGKKIGEKIISKVSKYVPIATKLLKKNILKLAGPVVGAAATAYDMGAIRRMMKDENLDVGAAIKKYYLDVEGEQTWEEWKEKNNPPAGSSRVNE